jgi:outer membrane receptor protein involved in Fe transport
MRLWNAIFSALLLGAVAASYAQTGARLNSEIPAQSVTQALAVFARETGLQVVYLDGVVGDQRSRTVPAGLTPQAALTRLLEGTGLHFKFLNDRSVRILPPPPPGGPETSKALTSVAPGPPLAEVLVTASSTTPAMERLPLSLTVWTASDLQTAQVTDTASLARLTPGVDFETYQDYSSGIETNLYLRGINARDGSAVALYVDDIPLPSDRITTFGPAFPALFDLERVEILRGPQGVLLGEGAEGGAIRFVTAKPGLTTFDGYTSAQYAVTEGGGPSYELGGALGGPLSPGLLGFRVSAWARHDGGFIDRVDPFTGAIVDANANRDRREAFSAALTLAPTEALHITPTVRYQSRVVNDSSAFYTYLSSPGDGVLRNGKLLAQPYEDASRLLSLRIEADLPFGELHTLSSYSARWATATNDFTNVSSRNFPNPLGPEYPVSYADAFPVFLSVDQYVTSQQLTFQSRENARVHWMIGGLWLRAHYQATQDIATLALDDVGNINGRVIADQSLTQLAAFAQADVQLEPRFNLSLGARADRASYDSTFLVNSIQTAQGSEPPEQTQIRGSNTPSAVQLSLSFQPSPDRLFYASFGNGYRIGGPNVTLGPLCPAQTPATYGPDAVWNFEVGTKASIEGGRAQLDASFFHMLWRNLQMPIPLPECGIGYLTNTGGARSDGFDLSARAHLTNRLLGGLSLAYADARYIQTVYLGSQVVANNGDAIGSVPLVPSPFSATATADYRLFSATSAIGVVHVQDTYRSRNHGPFTAYDPNAVIYAPERTPDPSTNRVDLSLSAQWRQLELSAFLNNAFNAQPTLQRRNRNPGDTLFYATTFRPRTVGLAVTWRLASRAYD